MKFSKKLSKMIHNSHNYHFITNLMAFVNFYSGSRKIYKCWIYTLKQFPDDFLKKYEFRSEYRNSVEQPYKERYVV